MEILTAPRKRIVMVMISAMPWIVKALKDRRAQMELMGLMVKREQQVETAPWERLVRRGREALQDLRDRQEKTG